MLRFTRLVSGVSTNSFLLNIKHYVEQYCAEYPDLVSLFMRSITVDDVSFGVDDKESTFKLYSKSREILSRGGFSLHKFVNRSSLLSHRIEVKEQSLEVARNDKPKIVEKDIKMSLFVNSILYSKNFISKKGCCIWFL